MSGTEIENLIQQAKQYLQSQKLSRARRCYNRIIAIDPDHSEGHYFLGWIAHQQKDVQTARQHLERAYALETQNKTYLTGLAELYSHIGLFEDAVRVYGNYLNDVAGKDLEVSINLAGILARSKNFEGAIDRLCRCIDSFPEELSPRMQLGNLFYQLLRFKEAQEVYLTAIEAGLKSEGLYLNAAKLYVDHGELDSAIEILQKGSRDFPDNLSFAYRLGQLDSSSLTPELFASLSALEEGALQGDNKFYHQWLLANFAKKRAEPLVEMEHLVQAHRVYELITRFPRNTDFYLQALPQLTPPDSGSVNAIFSELEPIYIVGVPRCGSTLLENIICHGPTDIGKGEETGAVLDSLGAAYQNQGQDFWSTFAAELESRYQRHNLLNGMRRFTDKSLENIFLIDFIMTLMPRAKVIYCDRAPLASIVSIMRNNMSVLPWAHNLENIFKYVDNCIGVAAVIEERYASRFLKMSYEELVCDPVAQSKKLMDFCDLPWDQSCLDFHKTDDLLSRTASHVQIRKKINQDAVSAYQQYGEFFAPFSDRYNWVGLK